MHLEEFLTEADSGGDGIVQNDGRSAKGLVLDGFDVRTEVAAVAHQEERGEIAKHIRQPRESAADADVLFHFVMTGVAKRDQVLQPVGFHIRREGAEWSLVVYVVLAR